MNGQQALLMKAFHEAGNVQRFHTLPHFGDASVGRHSWGVATIILTMCDFTPSLELIKAALWHDNHERWSGDCPSPARRAQPELQAGEDAIQTRFWAWADEPHVELMLSPRERWWLKFADALECILWMQDQKHMGNAHMISGMESTYTIVIKMIEDHAEHLLDPEGLIDTVRGLFGAGSYPQPPRLPESFTDLEKL